MCCIRAPTLPHPPPYPRSPIYAQNQTADCWDQAHYNISTIRCCYGITYLPDIWSRQTMIKINETQYAKSLF